MTSDEQRLAHAQLTRAEIARLNGSKSRGPRTPEGKARSARNALKHGLTAEVGLLLPGEDGAAYRQLLDELTACYRPRSALAAHLVERLASVMWRQRRADRLEAEVLSQRERRPDRSYLDGYLPGSPECWDAARFSAVQRQQARLDRALFRLIDELERLAPDPDGEPAVDEAELQNEPEQPPLPALSTDVLPLTPDLAAFLRDHPDDEEAGQRFAANRIRQVNAFLGAQRHRRAAGG